MHRLRKGHDFNPVIFLSSNAHRNERKEGWLSGERAILRIDS